MLIWESILYYFQDENIIELDRKERQTLVLTTCWQRTAVDLGSGDESEAAETGAGTGLCSGDDLLSKVLAYAQKKRSRLEKLTQDRNWNPRSIEVDTGGAGKEAFIPNSFCIS